VLSTKDFDRGIPWLLLAIEAGLIVLSVLLALSLAGWREARANERLAVQAVQGIVTEASTNCAQVTALHPYHQRVAEGEQAPEGLRIGMSKDLMTIGDVDNPVIRGQFDTRALYLTCYQAYATRFNTSGKVRSQSA
jgi:uncharacterized membrane protein